MSNDIHPSQTPEFWEQLAKTELGFAKMARLDRRTSVESILIYERNAAEYLETAKKLREAAA